MSPPERGSGEGVRFAATFEETRLASALVSEERFRDALRHAGLVVAGAARRPSRSPVVRALYVHGVYDDQVRNFRSLLTRLNAIGPFLSTADVLDVVAGRRTVEAAAFHLSFDDGFDNNYRNAFPILQEMGIRAAFFVPSAFIGATDNDVIDRWWVAEKARKPTRPMRWEWLREMSAAGHEIGSHTRHHVRLSAISADAAKLAEEVAGSKREIEDHLGTGCRSIAWPYGTALDLDERSRDAVQEAGYSLCFGGMRGYVRPSSPNIARHHFEANWPWMHVRYFALGGSEKLFR
jgi:Polysaccharide deacetylase